MSSVLVVIVNWCRAADTIECIDSVIRLSGVSFDVVMVENASPDSSYGDLSGHLSTLGKIVDKSTTHDLVTYQVGAAEAGLHIHLIRSARNLGFAGGNNLGLEAVGRLDKYRYIWFLNNDTIVQRDSLRALMFRALQSPRVDICGSTLLYSSRRTIVQCLGGGCGSIWSGMTTEIGNGAVWPSTVDEMSVEQSLNYIAGASMLVSRELLERVGFLDDGYFLFYEEWDLAVRARRAGFSIGYAVDSIVYHKEGASIGTGKSEARSLLAEFYGLRSKLRFTRRFYPWALPSVWLISWLQVLRRLVQRQPKKAALMARVLLGFGSAPQQR